MDGPDRERGVGLRVPDLECRTGDRSNFALKMVPAKDGFCDGNHEAGWDPSCFTKAHGAAGADVHTNMDGFPESIRRRK
jgi:hypothetical protein